VSSPQLPTAEQIEMSLRAARRWKAESELPDVVDLRDLCARPDLAAAVVRDRRIRQTEPGRPRDFRYPKPSGAFRRTIAFDPYMETDYRLRVGQVVGCIESELGDDVYRTRTNGHGPGWATANWRPSYKRMKAAIEYQRTLSGVAAEVSADVENHYGSIRLDHLQGMLASAGVDDCSFAGLAELLGRLRSIPGLAGGLPVSVEASAPLGTVALVGLDRRLRRPAIGSRGGWTIWC